MLANPEAERMVLGAILVDNDAVAEVAPFLTPGHFSSPGRKRVYEAILALHERGSQIDLVTLRSELGSDITLCNGVPGLAALTDGMPRVTNVAQWARMICDKAVLRDSVAACERGIDQAKSGTITAQDLVAAMSTRLQSLLNSTQFGVQKLREVIPAAIKSLEEYATSATGILGVPTGFSDIDSQTRGLMPGALWVLAARPGRGKSTWCMQVASHAAQQGRKVLLFSMEMPPPTVGERMLLNEAEVSRTDLRPPDRKTEQWARVNAAEVKLSTLPIWFDPRESPTVTQIRATAKQHAAAHGLDLVVVDYIQRCALPPKQERWEAVGDIAKGLKTLARALDVPVLAACQLTADAEEKRPTMADLAQARQVIAAEADVIAFLHPEQPDQWRTQDFPQMNFFMDKQRDGQMGKIALSFEKAKLRFVQVADAWQEEAARSGR